jgi:hypothetical protein
MFYAGLAAWAWEELVGGIKWVRRVLGAGGLAYEGRLGARGMRPIAG